MSGELRISNKMLDDLDELLGNAEKKIDEEIQYFMANGKWRERSEHEKLMDRLKLAKGVDGTICLVDNETMQAYKTGGYEQAYELVEPLEFENNFSFDRWARSLDV